MKKKAYQEAATSEYLTKLREIAESVPCNDGEYSEAEKNNFECHLSKSEALAYEIELCLVGKSINSGLPESELYELLVRLEKLRIAHACLAQIFARRCGNSWTYVY